MASVSPTQSSPSPTPQDHGIIFDLDLEKQRSMHRRRKKGAKNRNNEDGETSTLSQASESATLMSQHSMNIGCYTINLGTERGQKLHRYHLIILPLIPIMILLIQNYSTYSTNTEIIQDLEDVTTQVRNSLDFAELTKKLQQERVSVAFKFFIESRESKFNKTMYDC